jgi:hypothetical protein
MHIISRRNHGILDYVVGIILILAPTLFGFSNEGIAERVPMVLGIATLVYSLFTQYELGLFKVLPFRGHLLLDILNGLTLAASPWIFHFADRVWIPHLVLGLLELAVVLLTETSPSTSHLHHRATHSMP